MRKIALALLGTAASALLSFSTASAADLGARPVYKAPMPVEAGFSWTGFYVGVGAGWQRDETDWTTTGIFADARTPAVAGRLGLGGPTAQFDKDSARLSLYAGYNWQISSSWLIGLEGDVGTTFGNDSSLNYIPGTVFGAPGTNTPLGDITTVKHDWNASIRGRLGFLATPTLLLYGTGGVAFENEKDSLFCPGGGAGNSRWCVANRAENHSKTLVGWTAGAGIEGVVWGNWLARLEYRYSEFEDFDNAYFQGTNIDEVFATTKLKTSTVTLGLAYKFGGPVVARY
jgi:outer membrane immunogenic protein